MIKFKICGEIPIVSDTYEPGSTFKIITMAAAMEEGLIHDDDVFVCNEVRPW